MMQTQAEIVADFLAMWDRPGGFRQSIEKWFGPDSIYENVGMSKCIGKEQCLAFTDWYDQTTGGGWMVAKTLTTAVSGAMVLNERIDDMVDGQGNVFVTTPVMGSFEVKDGKILVWKDYFDTSSVPGYTGPGAIAKA
jgi:limonene-1,2-epoxide hydrolase